MRRVSIVLVAALLAGGCGAGGSGSGTPGVAPTPAGTGGPAEGALPEQRSVATAATLGAGARHNAADVEFVRALIPHHREGIALAGTVAGDARARTLAEAIIVTQQDEVVRMSDWLRGWGVAPVASTSPRATAADPVRALIAHQEKAVTIAQQEQANGANPAALAFARQIVESRTGEIAQLRAYLAAG